MGESSLSQENDCNRPVHLQIPNPLCPLQHQHIHPPIHLGSSVTEKFCSDTGATGWLVIDYNQTNQPGNRRSRQYSRPCISPRIPNKDCRESQIRAHTQNRPGILRPRKHTHQRFHQDLAPFSNWFTLLTKMIAMRGNWILRRNTFLQGSVCEAISHSKAVINIDIKC